MSTSNYSKIYQYTRHGGAYDCGRTDGLHGRPRQPHYYVRATYSSDMITQENMNDDEVAAYNSGYDEASAYNSGYDVQEADGTKKE